jgi:hypothetical protein
MKRRDALTALAAVPLAAIATSAQAKQPKKKVKASADEPSHAASANGSEKSMLPTAAISVENVDLTVHKQTMPMGPPMYSGTIIATVDVPSSDWRVVAVQGLVSRGTQDYGPVVLTKSDFTGKYSNQTPLPFPGAVAGDVVVAKALAVYEFKTRGTDQDTVLS